MHTPAEKTATCGDPAALFVSSDVYRQAAFGEHHPLSIIRVSGVVDLCRMLGWFEPGEYRDSPRASEAELLKFHDADYVAALRRAYRPEVYERWRPRPPIDLIRWP